MHLSPRRPQLARNTTKYVNAAHKAPQQVHFSERLDTRENPREDAFTRTAAVYHLDT